MAALGYDRAFIDEAGNAVGIIGAGPRQIVLLGHMDTVGGDVPVRYDERRALRPRHGRRQRAAVRLRPGARSASPEKRRLCRRPCWWQLIVVGATEEEAASSRGARFAATQYRAELCVIGEPSGSGRHHAGLQRPPADQRALGAVVAAHRPARRKRQRSRPCRFGTTSPRRSRRSMPTSPKPSTRSCPRCARFSPAMTGSKSGATS